MKSFGWFILGLVVAISGQALAQSYWQYDTQGNQMEIWEVAPGTHGYGDGKGNIGTIHPGSVLPALPRHPC